MCYESDATLHTTPICYMPNKGPIKPGQDYDAPFCPLALYQSSVIQLPTYLKLMPLRRQAASEKLGSSDQSGHLSY